MVIIRCAGQDDLEAIHLLTQTVYAEYRVLLPYSSIWQETPAVIAHEMALGPIFLALFKHQLVGSVRCHVQQPEGESAFLYGHRLAVLSAYRRQGVGRALMNAVETFAHSWGLAEVRLEVRAAQPESQAFYTRLGYQRGTVSRVLADGQPQSYWMTKGIS